MGLTTSDRHRIMYNEWREEGLDYEEIINIVPKATRERFIKDINKSYIESHFGMKNKWFFTMIIIWIIGVIIIAICLG